jgi:hypothetical protein
MIEEQMRFAEILATRNNENNSNALEGVVGP